MGIGTLTIYSASAGSGKTFRLAGNYLTTLFRSKYQYRKILAVTFTNKATAEMKGRILDQLNRLASGAGSEYLDDLKASTGRTEEKLRIEAKEILFSILHDYSRFSVCTIDAFFQKIIRAFARECGLNSGFSIELDHRMILSSAVDEMIASSAYDPRLNSWLISYILSNLDEEKTWNVREGIIKLSEELFREKFKILSADEVAKLEDKNFLLDYINNLKSLKSSFEKKMVDLGIKANSFFTGYRLTDDMFYNKSRGVPGYIRSLLEGKINKPGDKVRAIYSNPPRWATGEPSPQLQNAIENGLGKSVIEALRFYDDNILHYKTVNSILPNIYALGILSDVIRKVHQVATDSNIFLISDAGELLSLITKGDQTPFIYEKIGTRFENFMIDEFQDTSILQWNNFRPLINNSMAEGYDNLVVGDVKQSIYRFRNSDWKILGSMLESEVDNKRIFSVPLNKNYRSRSNIITFNNTLFSLIPEIIDQNFSENLSGTKFKSLYTEAVQSDPGKTSGGYIRIDFVEDGSEDDTENNEKDISDHGIDGKSNGKWNKKVLEKLPLIIETFLNRGYDPSDIGILVRDRREGMEVLKSVIEYSGRADGSDKNAYNIVSNDSLILSNSNAVTFVISVLKVIIDSEDYISRALMLRYYLLATEKESFDQVPLFRENLVDRSQYHLPEGYDNFLAKARQMTLFEAAEAIVDYFTLGKYSCNVPYLTAFLDLVLDYSKSKDPGFNSFIDWWETSGASKSLILPYGLDAVKVFTIHKSKGLEFPVVILPFLSWNLEHRPSRQPIIWAKPTVPPFNDLGIIPVRYKSELAETIFADSYNEERYSSYLDNTNLLYVAMTRAIDAIYGFIPDRPGPFNGMAKIIKEALLTDINPIGDSGIVLSKMYDREKKQFEFDEIPGHAREKYVNKNVVLTTYEVKKRPKSLRLKLHSENYFSPVEKKSQMKIYGLIMHEVFEAIDSKDDIPAAVERLVLEGKIVEKEKESTKTKLKDLISASPVSGWFQPGNILLKEARILLPSGTIRRPDRVVIKDGKATIIDFKFGEENPHYSDQVNLYRNLLEGMGYNETEAFIWYVDSNKIVKI